MAAAGTSPRCSCPAPRGSPTAIRCTTRSGRPPPKWACRWRCTSTTRVSARSGPLTGAGMPDFYTEFHTLNGASLQGHLVSILCHGVFERHPGAKVVFMEGGLVGYVGVLWRLDQNWRATRSEIPWCRRRPSEYVWDHVRFTTQPLEEPDDPQQLADVLAPLHPERTLMYATDYPHWDFDDPDQTLRDASGAVAGADPVRHRGVALRRAGHRGRMRTLRFPREAAPAPGEVRTVEADGRRVGLMWVDGELYGLADACPHRGAPLCSAGTLVHRVESDGRQRDPACVGRPAALPVAQVGVRRPHRGLRGSTANARAALSGVARGRRDRRVAGPGQGLSRRSQRCERALPHRGVQPVRGKVDGQQADRSGRARGAGRPARPVPARTRRPPRRDRPSRSGRARPEAPAATGSSTSVCAIRGSSGHGPLPGRPVECRQSHPDKARRRIGQRPAQPRTHAHHPRSRCLGDHPRAHGTLGHREHHRLAELGRERREIRSGSLGERRIDTARERGDARPDRPASTVPTCRAHVGERGEHARHRRPRHSRLARHTCDRCAGMQRETLEDLECTPNRFVAPSTGQGTELVGQRRRL